MAHYRRGHSSRSEQGKLQLYFTNLFIHHSPISNQCVYARHSLPKRQAMQSPTRSQSSSGLVVCLNALLFSSESESPQSSIPRAISFAITRTPRRALLFAIRIHHVSARHSCKLRFLQHSPQFCVPWIDKFEGL